MNQPRSRTITPDSFSVAPELLGRPLASPWRRAAAMLIDMAVIAILIAIGWPAFFGTVLVFILLRMSSRSSTTPGKSSKTRKALRIAAAIVVFLLGLNLWQALSGPDNDEDEADPVVAENAGGSSTTFGNVNLKLSMRDLIALPRLTLGLRGADEPGDARRLADSLVAVLKRSDASLDDMADLRVYVHENTESQNNDLVRLAIDSAFGVSLATKASDDDSLALAYSAALRAGNQAHVDSLRAQLGNVLAADHIASLRSELNEERKQNEQLNERVERLSHRGSVRTMVGGVADDLGLGFGWFAVYFTSFLALMRGQTPGKRLLGLRVVRLDAKPIGWWIAFERFGGYVASATLGLLGFLQVLWDRNRQGFHDKAVETVVIRT